LSAILLGVTLSGCAVTIESKLTTVPKEYRTSVYQKCVVRNKLLPSEKVEELVKEIDNPLDAYKNVLRNIRFATGLSWDKNHPNGQKPICERYGLLRHLPIQESYRVNQGACLEGAIAFAALLNDDPKYKVQIVILQSKKSGHAIAAFEEKGKGWGFVSFNETSYREYAIFREPHEDSLQKVIQSYLRSNNNRNHFDRYAYLDMTADEIKYRSFFWYQINNRIAPYVKIR